MNIAQLTHHSNQAIASQLPHYNTFTICPQSQFYWYFYSAKHCTLRKKLANTSIRSYLQLSQSEKPYYLYIIRQDDYGRQNIVGTSKINIDKTKHSQVKSIQPIQTKTKGVIKYKKDDEILRDNNWKPSEYQKITLLKDGCFVQCIGLPTQQNHMKDKLSQYCLTLKRLLQERTFKVQSNQFELSKQVRQFQLIFMYNQNLGLLKLLFIHNIKLKSQQQIYYATNFKVGQDDYERLQLEAKRQIKQQKQQQKENAPFNVQFVGSLEPKQEQFEINRIRYLNLLRKLAEQSISKNNDRTNRQQRQIIKQYVCSACRIPVTVYAQPTENSSPHAKYIANAERLISSNRIPEIQLLRQIKINKNHSTVKDYELVPVCQICYLKFIEIVKQKQNNRGNIYTKNKQNKAGSLFSIQKSKQKQTSFNKQFTTLKQDIQQIAKNQDKINKVYNNFLIDNKLKSRSEKNKDDQVTADKATAEISSVGTIPNSITVHNKPQNHKYSFYHKNRHSLVSKQKRVYSFINTRGSKQQVNDRKENTSFQIFLQNDKQAYEITDQTKHQSTAQQLFKAMQEYQGFCSTSKCSSYAKGKRHKLSKRSHNF